MDVVKDLTALDQEPTQRFPRLDIIMSNWTNISIFLQTEPLTWKDILYMLKYELETKKRVSIIHRLFTKYYSLKKASEWIKLLEKYRLEKYI